MERLNRSKPIAHSKPHALLQAVACSLFAVVVCGHDGFAQEAQKWGGLGRIFRQRGGDSVEQQQPAIRSNKPAELKVIDRATAARNAYYREYSGNPSDRRLASQESHESPQGWGATPAGGCEAGVSQSARSSSSSSSVSQASFQQSERVYQSRPYSVRPYDVPPWYGLPSPGSDRQIYSERSDLRAEALPPEQSWNPADETYGQDSMEHPSRNGYFARDPLALRDSESPLAGFRNESNESSPDRPSYENPPSYHDDPTFHGYAAGRGYLEQGPTFQSHQQRRPTTATERALGLQRENELLHDQVRRLREELATSNGKMAAAEASQVRKDEELKLAADRVTRLEHQVNKLIAERDRVVNERIAAEQQFSKQLKDIEDKLDGVLVNELTDADK